ncbi:MAG: DUF1573 domain-containing protein [Planctomycetes bacterium]|nr:DUF1573 domain-containing protein [Planctomycetota bacterium]
MSPSATGGLEIVDAPNAEMPWDYDLGIVPYGETAECTARLRNGEGRELRILELQAACSCTTATVSYVDASGARIEGDRNAPTGEPMLVLPPGAVAELRMVSDTRSVPIQNQTKRVRIVLTTDSATNPFLAIEVHLIVELAFMATPGTLKLGDVTASEGARGALKILSLGVDGRRLTGIERASPGVVAAVSHDDGVVPDQWNLSVDVGAPIELGMFERFVEIATTGPRGEGVGKPMRVPIVGNGVPDLEVRPTKLIFAGLKAETTAEVELLGHLAGQRLRVLGLRPDARGEGLVFATAEPEFADDSGRSPRWRIRARLAAEAPADLAGILTVETDELGEIAIPYAVAPRR